MMVRRQTDSPGEDHTSERAYFCASHNAVVSKLDSSIMEITRLIATVRTTAAVLGVIWILLSGILSFYINRAMIIADDVVELKKNLALSEKQIGIDSLRLNELEEWRREIDTQMTENKFYHSRSK